MENSMTDVSVSLRLPLYISNWGKAERYFHGITYFLFKFKLFSALKIKAVNKTNEKSN